MYIKLHRRAPRREKPAAGAPTVPRLMLLADCMWNNCDLKETTSSHAKKLRTPPMLTLERPERELQEGPRQPHAGPRELPDSPCPRRPQLPAPRTHGMDVYVESAKICHAQGGPRKALKEPRDARTPYPPTYFDLPTHLPNLPTHPPAYPHTHPPA